MGFRKGERRRSDGHPLAHMAPEARWESAISLFAAMFRDFLQDRKSSAPKPVANTTQVRHRPQKPIRLHVVYEDFEGRVWHEHDSVYPDPRTSDAPAGKPPADTSR